MVNYLCFTAQEANSTIKLNKTGSSYAISLKYFTTDKESALDFIPNSTTITLANIGDKVYIFGDNSEFSRSPSTSYYQFKMTGLIAVSGSIMTLVDSTDTLRKVNADMFCNLFEGCTSLTQAPILPATKIGTSSYELMFKDCTNLITAPALPATDIGGWCYRGMFQNCTNMTTAPHKLPATTIYEKCYYSMFYGCQNLIAAPALPAIKLAEQCYRAMFYGCASLTTVPALPATQNISGTYNNMFQNCSALQVYTDSAETHKWQWSIPTNDSLPLPAEQGYMFTGTTGDYSSTTKQYLPMTVYTQNKPVTLYKTVIMHNNGGTLVVPGEGSFENYTYEAETFKTVNAVKQNSSFINWVDSEGNIVNIIPGEEIISDLEVWATYIDSPNGLNMAECEFWQTISSGEHNLQIQATTNNYASSDLSDEVSFTK